MKRITKKALKKIFVIFERHHFIKLSSYFAVWKVCTIQTRMQLSRVYIAPIREDEDSEPNNILDLSKVSALNYSQWQKDLNED